MYSREREIEIDSNLYSKSMQPDCSAANFPWSHGR